MVKSGQKAYSTVRLPMKSYARSPKPLPTRIVHSADKPSSCVPGYSPVSGGEAAHPAWVRVHLARARRRVRAARVLYRPKGQAPRFTRILGDVCPLSKGRGVVFGLGGRFFRRRFGLWFRRSVSRRVGWRICERLATFVVRLSVAVDGAPTFT
jgi:hypothetical protein